MMFLFVFFFKQSTAYELRISDWSSDVCSSDLQRHAALHYYASDQQEARWRRPVAVQGPERQIPVRRVRRHGQGRGPGLRRLLLAEAGPERAGDRQSVVEGKGGCVSVDPEGRRSIKQKKT